MPCSFSHGPEPYMAGGAAYMEYDQVEQYYIEGIQNDVEEKADMIGL